MISWKSIKVLDDLHNVSIKLGIYNGNYLFVVWGKEVRNKGEIVSRWINVNIYIHVFVFFSEREKCL